MDTLDELKNKLAQNKENRNTAVNRFHDEDTVITANENKVANTVGVLLEKERMVFASDREILLNQVMGKMDGYDNKLTDVGELARQLNENITETEHLKTLYAIKRENLENDLYEREVALERSLKAKEEKLKNRFEQLNKKLRKETSNIEEYNQELKEETHRLEEVKYTQFLIFIRNTVFVILTAMFAFWAIRFIWVGGQNWIRDFLTFQ